MKTQSNKRALVFSASAILLLSACGVEETPKTSIPVAPKNIVQVASSEQDLSILVEAVTAANLGTTLSGTGPFTVFAPTNAAFAALLDELGISKEALLADKALLTAVLTYHVVNGKVMASAVPSIIGKPTATIAGGVFRISKSGATLSLNDERNRRSNITATDIEASNGVIHLVDKVVLPGDKNIVQTAQANPDFSILVEAVIAADLVSTLSSKGPFTVFAPTNTAFANLLSELGISKSDLLADKALLADVLTYHVVAARVFAADVPIGQPVASVQTGTFSIDANLSFVDARGRSGAITTTDLLTSNGTIHVVDKVLLPAP